MKVVNIAWDTDGEDIDTLPTEVEIPEMPEDEIADYLSDNFGFCVFSFSLENE